MQGRPVGRKGGIGIESLGEGKDKAVTRCGCGRLFVDRFSMIPLLLSVDWVNRMKETRGVVRLPSWRTVHDELNGMSTSSTSLTTLLPSLLALVLHLLAMKACQSHAVYLDNPAFAHHPSQAQKFPLHLVIYPSVFPVGSIVVPSPQRHLA